MSEDRKFFGITQNECAIQGKVVGKPTVNGENFAFMWLEVANVDQDANGQWVESAQNVPIMTQDTRKVATIAKYVDDGRELLINAYYKSWEQGGAMQHAFVIKKMTLGRKKFVPQNEATPDLPG
jgi:hypothetical protein